MELILMIITIINNEGEKKEKVRIKERIWKKDIENNSNLKKKKKKEVKVNEKTADTTTTTTINSTNYKMIIIVVGSFRIAPKGLEKRLKELEIRG